jgi:hypothetical protein
MKKPLKMALFSGLIFPGLGHLLLKKYLRAGALFTSFAVSSYFYFTDAMAKAETILAKVQSGELALDTAAITKAIENINTGFSQQQLSLLSYVMLFIWLAAIIDSYRVAKKTESQLVE